MRETSYFKKSVKSENVVKPNSNQRKMNFIRNFTYCASFSLAKVVVVR